MTKKSMSSCATLQFPLFIIILIFDIAHSHCRMHHASQVIKSNAKRNALQKPVRNESVCGKGEQVCVALTCEEKWKKKRKINGGQHIWRNC